jgi:hypothetical protein
MSLHSCEAGQKREAKRLASSWGGKFKAAEGQNHASLHGKEATLWGRKHGNPPLRM